MSRRLLIAAVLLASAGAVALWRLSPAPARSKPLVGAGGPRHVVLLVVCTLRADHLPFYGYSKDTAPFLNRLAAGSAVFDHAFSTSGWTAPSTASIHTGLYPTQHGVIYGMEHTRQLQKQGADIVLNRIPDDLETIAEMLKARGFRTFAVTDNPNLVEEEGFTQGFDRFQNFHYATAEGVARKLLDWQDELDRAEHYFVYLNFIDPHAPYHKRAESYPAGEPGIGKPIPLVNVTRRQLIDAYDSEIRFLDRRVEGLFRRFGWEQNALVVFVADHGEEFGEHRVWGHGSTLHQEIVHVPLLFHAPGGSIAPRRVAHNVSQVDVLPTLRELVGAPPSARDVGRSLVPVLTGAPADQDLAQRYLFGYLERRATPGRPANLEWFAVQGSWKLLLSKVRAPALYDLRADPGEKVNVLERVPDHAARLREALDRFEATAERYGGETVTVPATDELMETLKSLGYVGDGSPGKPR